MLEGRYLCIDSWPFRSRLDGTTGRGDVRSLLLRWPPDNSPTHLQNRLGSNNTSRAFISCLENY